MTTDIEVNELTVIVQNQGIEPSKVEGLLVSFGTYFDQAKTIAHQARGIIVTDESQVAEMEKARQARLALKAIRVSVDKTRVSLKEQALREGRAIDGIANVIKALVVPVEEHLEKQEKFAELKEQARLASRYADRVEQLSKYVLETNMYDLRGMTDEQFTTLIADCKLAYDNRIAAEKKAEEEKEAKLKAYREEQEQIRIENARLKKEAEEKDAALAKERAEQQKKIDAERKAREDLEAKVAAEKKIREEQAKAEADKLEAARKEEERLKTQRLLAPDKEKLGLFIMSLDLLKVPQVEDRAVGKVIDEACQQIQALVTKLRLYEKTL